jgi:hypothetical protein
LKHCVDFCNNVPILLQSNFHFSMKELVNFRSVTDRQKLTGSNINSVFSSRSTVVFHNGRTSECVGFLINARVDLLKLRSVEDFNRLNKLVHVICQLLSCSYPLLQVGDCEVASLVPLPFLCTATLLGDFTSTVIAFVVTLT